MFHMDFQSKYKVYLSSRLMLIQKHFKSAIFVFIKRLLKCSQRKVYYVICTAKKHLVEYRLYPVSVSFSAFSFFRSSERLKIVL